MASIERTNVENIDREVYDIKNEFTYEYKTDAGLTENIIKDISKQKNEPQWMLDFRL